MKSCRESARCRAPSNGDVSLLVLLVAAALGASPAVAQEPAPGPAFSTRLAFKSSVLFSRVPDAPELFPERDSAAAFWRLRLETTVRAGRFGLEAAVEPRARLFSSTTGISGIGVEENPAPWRIRQLDWSLHSSAHTESRLEIDRAAVRTRLGRAELILGRQAIGWGRGVLFGAVDLFAPFTPLEPDREWRRGVDAVRADLKLADRVSLDVVGAFGEAADASVYAARLRGYRGNVDIELVGGRRARDAFAGVTSSVAIGGTEVHGEFAAFRLPGRATPLLAQTVVKALAGGSWRVPAGNGVLVFAEYHYSGLGAPSAADALRYLADLDFRTRYGRGDMQMLTRHALAVLASYEQSPETTWAVQWLQSPVDGSGVVVPSATVTFSDRLSIVLNGYLPYGRRPEGASLGSDFGAAPLGLFAQLRIYR